MEDAVVDGGCEVDVVEGDGKVDGDGEVSRWFYYPSTPS